MTRRQLTEGPEFAVTLDKADELDGFHVVFGVVLEGMPVIDAIAELPTYSYKTRTGYGGKERGVENGIADQWFEAQKNFYVDIGQLERQNMSLLILPIMPVPYTLCYKFSHPCNTTPLLDHSHLTYCISF